MLRRRPLVRIFDATSWTSGALPQRWSAFVARLT